MVEKKIVVTCDECGSTDVKTKAEYYNQRYRMVKDAATLDRAYLSLKSVDIKLLCHCNNCGRDFEEELGRETYDLLPGEIED